MADSTPLKHLNLDQTLPKQYSENQNTNEKDAGVIRYITGADVNTTSTLTRLFGDVVFRFRLIEQKINEIINALISNPYTSSFNNSRFVMVDGTHPFVKPVEGVDPTKDAHLATKSYTDSGDEALGERIDSVEEQLSDINVVTTLPFSSDWVEMEWNGATKQLVTFDLTYRGGNITPVPVPDMGKLLGLTIIQKLNIGSDEIPNYVYRFLSPSGTKWGNLIDDTWLEPPNKVKVLVPNQSAYPLGYPSTTGYDQVQDFRPVYYLKCVLLTEAGLQA